MPNLPRLLPLALLATLAGCQAASGGAPGDTTATGGNPATFSAPTHDTSIAQALRNQDWAAAAQLATRSADPLAPDLVTWLRLQTPNAASATEIASFLDTHPGWPGRGTLSARLSQALVSETDPKLLPALCTEQHLAATTPSLATLRACGQVVSATDPGFAALLRHAWISGLERPEDAAAFLGQWPGVTTPADDSARFDTLLAHNALAAAAKMQERVGAVQRLRLALRRDPVTGIPAATAAIATTPDPALLRDLARAQRRSGALDDAVALWTGPAAGLSDPASITERLTLSRDLLAAGRDADARRLADPGAATDPVARAEALFLAGWIAWRDHDQAAAAANFHALANTGSAPTTQARAHYWLSRVATTPDEATAEDRAASAWPTTFYGQLALARLLNGDTAAAFDPFTTAGLQTPAAMSFNAELARRLAAIPQPHWTRAQALDFAARPFARAASLLVAWEEPVEARGFLLRIATDETDPTIRAMAADDALHLGLPGTSVMISRLAGRDGAMLVDTGWAAPYRLPTDPSLPSGLIAGLIRQESSFDPLASSPAGARGLMQLLPGTANEVAVHHPDLGVRPPVSAAMLLDVPQLNIALGTAFLAGLVDRFGGDLPAAIGAYNAGPHRMDLWHVAPMPGPEPTGGPQAKVDWIESVPFNETRNYIQHVLENAAIYRARRGEQP